MEKTVINERKKCSQSEGNAINSNNVTRREQQNLSNKKSDFSKPDAKLRQNESKKTGKWREKLSRFCQNKPEKKLSEAENTVVANNKEPSVQTALPSGVTRNNLLKGKFVLTLRLFISLYSK